MTNNGFVSWDQPTLTLTGGAQLINRPGAVLTIQSNLTITNASGGPAALTNEGTLIKSGPGGPLTLNNLSFVTSGAVMLRVGDPTDGISANAGGTLAGVLNIDVQPGFVPAAGATFNLFAFSSRTGTFTQILSGAQPYSPTYTATGLSVTAQTAGTANLGVSQVDAPDPVLRGSTLTYTLSVSNLGPAAASVVSLVDSLPDGVTFVSAVSSQGSCTNTATAIVCSLGALAVDANATVTLTVVPTLSGLITNTAIVTGTEPDAVPANNVATATTTVAIPNTTFTVTTTADSGPGSLRAAMLAANASAGTIDTIVFAIPGAGPHSIALATFLPTITDPLYLDGTTQPGYAGTPLIELNGTGAGATANGVFIGAGGAGSTIRGLAINRFGTGGAVGAPGGAGIVIQGPGGNRIERNFLGTDPEGILARPNRADAIFIDNSPGNIIGGVSALSSNLLSGNSRFGLTLSGAGTVGTSVRNNLIGTNFSGAGPLPNGDAGIAIFGAAQNTIGGTDGLSSNTIAFNAGPGVHVATGLQNSVLGNSITLNGGLGINLGVGSVAANDPGDADTGPNNLLNFPVLSVVPNGVRVEFNSAPNSVYRLELFANTACDASGNGEGESFIGGIPMVTDSNGNFVLELFPGQDGEFVTATATDAAGNTSEFSNCAGIQPTITLSLPDALPIGVGRSVTATVTLPEPAPLGGVVVTVTSDAPTIASIEAPGTISIPEGGSAGQIAVSGVSVGTTTLRANATGYLAGTLGVAVTQNLISTPANLNVAFGQSTALPVNIGPSPAPPGGLTLDVVSINPSIVEIVTPQITVPEGALSANATVRGAGFGNATVTVSNPLYSSSTTTVTSSGGLNIVQTDVAFNDGLPAPLLTIRLESNGTPVAPLVDLAVTLSSTNTQCVSVPASVTIPAGLVSTTFRPAYGGTATLACNAVVTATSSGLTPDTVSITVNQQAGITMPGTVTAGASLAAPVSVTLGFAQHGGVTVTIQSDSPSRVLVAPNASTAGSASISVNVPDGQTIVTYYVHGLEGVTGSANVSLSAPGFAGGSHTVQVVPSGIEIVSLNAETTTLSTDDIDWYVQVGVPCAGNAQLCEVQIVRPGGLALMVSLALAPAPTPIAQLRSDQPLATGQTVIKPIQPGIYYTQAIAGSTAYGLTFEPLAGGQTSVTATGPAGVLTMTTTGVRPVTISGPPSRCPRR